MENTKNMISLASKLEKKYASNGFDPFKIDMDMIDRPSASALAVAPTAIITGRAQDIIKEVKDLLDVYARKTKFSSLEEDKVAQIMEYLKIAEKSIIAAKKMFGMTPSPKF